MTYLTWSSDLDTGIVEIDNQHKQIMDFINRLHDARQNADRANIIAVVDDLVEYTLSHFAFEECLIEDAGYEFVRGHKKVHELFVRRVNGFVERLGKGEDISHELHSLLHRWLFSHIRHDDAAYVAAVRPKIKALTETQAPSGWLSRSLKRFFGG
ncbi:MAG: bacteriohemerythrin [Zoogloea sp.]|uniref:bacteriohemerythrin n=1 Tax=Zoogloea sp. TaxID=49181 RepID=UPI00261C701B|nr:bacteriohemerythrin [Zoogloea sp.]MDD2989270.1 bacteriohemerythrin [Zoogloea sp.]